jgi:hypothetical protein
VAYHGELEKKAAMEQKRVISGENGETDGDGEYQKLQNFVQRFRVKKKMVSQSRKCSVGFVCSGGGVRLNPLCRLPAI